MSSGAGIFNKVNEDGSFKFDIWLVWGMLKRDGLMYLLAVTNTNEIAKKYKKYLEDPDSIESEWYVRIVIEPRQANHLYGASQP